jgi:isoquinoline 1-oxidoreductase beta subunit
VSVEHLQAGVDARGKPVAWLHRSVAPTILSTFDADAKQEAPFELGMGVINVPFAIPHVRIENPEAIAHTRIGWFRSVSNIPHAFAVQSFVAELAAAAGRDPKAFLLDVIGPARWVSPSTLSDIWNHGESPERYPVDTGRLRRVVETAAREARWGRALPKGRGLGIAAHYSFVTYVAAVVEVAVGDKGKLTIPRVDIAVDCGASGDRGHHVSPLIIGLREGQLAPVLETLTAAATVRLPCSARPCQSARCSPPITLGRLAFAP